MTTAPSPRIAFLLTQLGTEMASRFAQRTRGLGITPAEAGILRILARDDGLSQRALADKLRIVQSRVVALIDRMQESGLVERKRSSADRRNYELKLTAAGRELLNRLRPIAAEHEQESTAALTAHEQATLGQLLIKLAAAAGLDPEVHPGYRTPGNDASWPH
jgi:DNA-binding MarR family transcriptional regulator